jgi:hypothetical protein
MSRQSLVAAGGLLVVALLIAVTLYVTNLRAADAAPTQKPSATPGADQIKQLQARIESLEKRLATLEKSRTNTWDIIPINPPSPPLHYVPLPPPNDGEKDGFPKARIIFIDNNRAPVTNSDSAR